MKILHTAVATYTVKVPVAVLEDEGKEGNVEKHARLVADEILNEHQDTYDLKYEFQSLEITGETYI